MTVIRNDCYRIEEVGNKKYLVFRGLRIRVTGEIRWRGKQGRLEIHYDDLKGRWYAYQLRLITISQGVPPPLELSSTWEW